MCRFALAAIPEEEGMGLSSAERGLGCAAASTTTTTKRGKCVQAAAPSPQFTRSRPCDELLLAQRPAAARSGVPRLRRPRTPKPRATAALSAIPETPRSSLMVAASHATPAADPVRGVSDEVADNLCELPGARAATPKQRHRREQRHRRAHLCAGAGAAPPSSGAAGCRWLHSTIHAAGTTMATAECDRMMVAAGRTREDCARVARAWKITYDDAMALIVDVEAAQDGGTSMRNAECLLLR